MRIRILGPMEITREDGSLVLPAPRQKALLALLVIHRDRPLFVDYIREELWSEPPAPSAVRYHVSKLREALGTGSDGAASSIVTSPGGYSLQTEGLDLDAVRFERALAQGRNLLDTRPAAAARVLQRGLSLWRGPALVDFQYEDFARLEANRLEETRLSALELRIDADLALGRHSGLIAELDALVKLHPFRERLRFQLMLALYRSGLQSQALGAFEEAQKTMGEELGLEPGPELVELEHQILLQEPGLRPEAAPLEKAHRLPPDVSTFVGRAEIIGVGCELIAGSRLVTLVGPGGIGKTRLALAIGRRLEPSFADGAAFIPLGQLEESQEVFVALFEALEIPEAATADYRTSVLAYLENRSMLLVMDNCEQIASQAGTAATEILGHASGIKIVATSRAPLRATGEQVYRIPAMALPDAGGSLSEWPRFDAIALFLERAAQVGRPVAITDQSLGLVAAVCRELAGIPLAIELATARLPVLSLDQIHRRLDEQLTLLSAGPCDAPDRHRTLEGALRWSYELLGSDAQCLFRRLATTRGGFVYEAAEALTAESVVAPVETLDVLAALADSSLVEATASSPVRYRLLQPVRQFGEALLEAAGEVDMAGRLHAEHYAAVARREAAAIGTAGQLAATMTLREEHANIQSAVGWLLANSRADDAALVVANLSRWWVAAGFHAAASAWIARLLGAETLTPKHRMKLLRDGAYLALLQGRQGVAERLNTEQGELALLGGGAARAHHAYAEAELRWVLGDHRRAIHLWQDALSLYEEHDDSGVLFCRVNLGQALAAIGELEQARRMGAQILDPVDGNTEPEAEAFGEAVLARVAYIDGDLKDLEERALRAYEAFAEVGFEHHGVSALQDAGFARALRHETGAGIGMLERALRSHQRWGDRLAEDRCRILLGLARLEADDIGGAAATIEPTLLRLGTLVEPFELAETALLAALIASRLGRDGDAATMVGAADRWVASGAKVWPAAMDERRGALVATLRERLGNRRYADLAAHGSDLEADDLVRRGVSLMRADRGGSGPAPRS